MCAPDGAALAAADYARGLARLYVRLVGRTPEADELDAEVLRTFSAPLRAAGLLAIEHLVEAKPYIVDRIRTRAERKPFFAHACALAVYQLASAHPARTAREWPLPGAGGDIELIFSDLGNRYPV